MTEDDAPLLSTPSLTALILRRVEAGPVSLDGLMASLDALFDTAQETPTLPAAERRARLLRALRDLEIARLVRAKADGGWQITDRGSDALYRQPGGIDGSDLMAYPEYAAHVRAGTGGGKVDARGSSYDAGYDACRAGLGFTANPHTPNTADHLAWENGWMQALDDAAPPAA
ncbi:MAG: hypothetical protein JNK88_03535 [Mangrovicoccus sp.]|nr:hypothetical protein [Mangrovicoccus sp.]